MAVQNPRVPLALPTQGTLLLGLARIEAKQVEYLHGDAFEAKTHASSVSAASAVQAASALELAQPSARSVTTTIFLIVCSLIISQQISYLLQC